MTGQCVFCGHQHLTAKTTRYLQQNHEEMLIVEQVPCLECDFCGEQYFDIQALKKIGADHDDINTHRKLPSRFVQVAVAEFTAV